ncbi:RidA family protein [Labrenzia sp. OB1]|uniref:RidA family protein n=1 Tax=Labrenzia sp. OB1 TaxID=1561204 RepID=UPI0007B25366|nr:RidA family protein [Labrenzia sp. OB1]KZM49081.1 dfrA [Labrenzia sp. OB1]
MSPIDTPNAPAAIGPYSQAMRAGDLLFVSGQLPIDPATGEFASEDAVGQMRQCLKNIAAIAEAAGTDISKTVKTTILLTDLSGFAELNEEYGKAFQAPFPARACYEVAALPKGALVEIEAVIGC